jgi:hypothetical protein
MMTRTAQDERLSLVDASVQVHNDIDGSDQDLGGNEDNY